MANIRQILTTHSELFSCSPISFLRSQCFQGLLNMILIFTHGLLDITQDTVKITTILPLLFARPLFRHFIHEYPELIQRVRGLDI